MTIDDTNTDIDKFDALIDAAVDGDPTRVQCDPDERDPVCAETADEAWDTFQQTGLVNPFHAVSMQHRQNTEQQEKDRSLVDALEAEGFDE
jgi:hypothetical protein